MLIVDCCAIEKRTVMFTEHEQVFYLSVLYLCKDVWCSIQMCFKNIFALVVDLG
jgi:hypothetical protein